MRFHLPASIAAARPPGARAVWQAATHGLLVTFVGIALLASWAPPSLSTPQLGTQVMLYPTGAGSERVASGDLNRDGILDLVTANGIDNTVSVLIGRGDGSFAQHADYPTGRGPQRVVLADMNSDGLLDAITLNPTSGTVSVQIGNGGGGFRRLADLVVGNPGSTVIGDLNRDGLPDLVTAVGSAVSVVLGQGDGTFSPHVETPVGHRAGYVAIGDLDGDGNPDLAVAIPYVEQGVTIGFSVMRGNGDGTFTPGAAYYIDVPNEVPYSSVGPVILADLNGDTRLDLVEAVNWCDYLCGHGIEVFLGNGDGTFSSPIGFFTGKPPFLALATADLNGDSKADLVWTSSEPTVAVVELGRGDGTFGYGGTVYGTTAVAIDDLNGDGRADMAGVAGGNAVSVLIGSGDWRFESDIPTFGAGGCGSSVAIGDLNGDGRLDVVSAGAYQGGPSWSESSVSVLIADGRGGFAGSGVYVGEVVVDRVALGDLNGDQRPDLIVTVSTAVRVWLNNGSGGFGPEVCPDGCDETAVIPRDVAIGDLNRDGRGELVVLGDSGIEVLLGSGDGRFAHAGIHEPATSFRKFLLEDFDRDGDPDLALAKSGAVSVMLGDGTGSFSPQTEYAVGHDSYWIAAGDLNGDGRLDLVSVGSGSVATLLGRGDGSFTFVETVPVEGAHGQPAIGDLDEDGLPDVALAVGARVGVMEGAGDGTLSGPVIFASGGAGPWWTGIDDWNGDGRPDLGVIHGGWREYDDPYWWCSGGTIAVLFNKSVAPPKAMQFELTPHTLTLSSQGRWVTGFLELPPPLSASGINVSSIRLNGSVPVDAAAPVALGDHDGDGIPDLMVKFDRVSLELTVAEGDQVPVTVTGSVDGKPFSGTDHIRVRRGAISAPAADSRLGVGAVTQVRWEIPAGVKVPSVALLHSIDGGSSWSRVADGQPNTGSYDWRVPDASTHQAKVAVVAESVDDGSGNLGGVVGVSGAFSIGALVGVGDSGPSRLALAVRGPNPVASGRLWVEFALRDDSLARLELVDIAGRVLNATQVGHLGPGAHAIDVSQGHALRPGVYFVRLAQGGSEVRVRAAVLR